jgi:ribonuclease VapC
VVLDTSILLAIIFNESKATWCTDILNRNLGTLSMCTVNLAEVLILIRHRQAKDYENIRKELFKYPIEYIGPSVREAELASQARLRFPLNLGDCFAYALAKVRDRPLCTLDRDFAKCDLADLVLG